MADPDVGPETGSLLTPRAQAALLGGGLDTSDEDIRVRRAAYDRQIANAERLAKRGEELEAQREEEEKPIRADIAASLKEQSGTRKQALQSFLQGQQDISKPPSFQNMQADAMAWMNLAAAFGAIAGGLSRYHVTTALNAFAGMTTGFVKGNMQAFETNYKIWQANTDKALEYNARMQREYKAIMDDQKMDMDAKMNLYQMTANKWQDQIGANLAQQRDVERIAQIMEGRERFEEQLQFRRDQNAQHHDEMVQKVNAGLAPKGYKLDENGKVIPDPDNPSVFDDVTLNKLVERRLLGDKSVLQAIGRGAQGPTNTVKFNRRLAQVMEERGITAQDLVLADQQYAGGQSYQVAAGRYASRVENATNELRQAIPLAEKASQNVPRGDWVGWNRLQQLYKAGKSDPKYNDFILKAMSARTAYVKAMNPSGNPRIAERLELKADNILDTAVGSEGFSAQLQAMWQEAQNSRAAVAETRGLPAPEIEPYPVGGGAAPAGGAGGGGGNVTHYDSEGNPVQ